MTRHDDDQLASWMTIGPQNGPIGGVEDALARARRTRQRPAWLVAMTGGAIAAEPGGGILRAMALAVAVVALVGVLLGALVAGGILPPPFRPDPSALANETALPSATEAGPTAVPTPLPTPEARPGLVAYNLIEELDPGQADCNEDLPARWCQINRIWLSNTDGSDAYALHPDDTSGESFVTWSWDGTRIVYWLPQGGLAIATIAGDVERTVKYDDLCRYPCAGVEGMAISPDGTRLVYVRDSPDANYSSVITILDIATGAATELESTRTTNVAGNLCHESTACEGMNDQPQWSPDGTRIAFARQHISPEPGSPWTSGAVFVVNADGTNLQRVTPTGWFAITPNWSPDGRYLAFINVEQTLSGDGLSVDMEHSDIYSIRPNGNDLVRLTNNGTSFRPEWTQEGRITFGRWVMIGEEQDHQTWIMESDGTAQARLPESLEALSAAGCEVCIYPFPAPGTGPSYAYWQPVP